MSLDPSAEIPPGKYNKWCERRALVCADETKIFRTDQYVMDRNLSLSEKAAYYVHELVDCQGLEFVAFSNAHIQQPVELPGKIMLVPCFLPELGNMDSPLAKLTLDMAHNARFIYDGWLPIDDWQRASVRKAIRMIESALSIFAVRASAWFSWEPKYSPMMQGGIYYEFTKEDVKQVNRLAEFVNEMKEADRQALLSSIGWLSQSVRLTETAARFLFGILTIESLATYIERESVQDSVFSNLRSEQLTSQQRKEWRQACIKDVMATLLDTNPEEAVSRAYFDCIIGIRRLLQSHLVRLFKEDTEPSDLLFNMKIDGKTLYDLRHEIAHGSMDSLSEVQREQVLTRARDVERIARKYILKVLENITGYELAEHEIIETISPRLREGFFTKESMYKGPIHMAQVYASTYADSITGGT